MEADIRGHNVCGPYTNVYNSRLFVVSYDPLKRETTSRSYARYLMELHLGRELTKDEIVDHINDDYTDNRIENFQLLTVSENCRKGNNKNKKIQYYTFNCPICGKEATIEYRQYRSNQLRLGRPGPHCSRSCARKAFFKLRAAKICYVEECVEEVSKIINK